MLLQLATNLATHQFTAQRKCQWPLWADGERDYKFCDDSVTTPGPYCDDCRKKAYLKRNQLAEAAD